MDQDWWRTVQSDDVEQHARHLGQFHWRYDQLSGGAFRAQLAELAMPRVRVFREHTSHSTEQSGSLPAGSIGVGLALLEDNPLWMNGMRIAGDRIIVSHDSGVELCTSPDCELGFVVADAAVMEEILQRTGARMAANLVGKASVTQLPKSSERALRQLLSLVHGNFGVAPDSLQSENARRLLEDQFMLELVDALTAATVLPEECNALLRKRVVDRARERMRENPDRPMSILEVCNRVGASRRKLEYCFQEVLGTTPVAYMRAIRLNGVRRELLRAQEGERIYDIAVRWGFWHFSQFSADYKRQFGELPSHTLLRSKGA
ncbi:helix-turn-helix domain-containing protein [Massilia sp. MB5]|uniref:helix-turn-helix domain-containing protein n=1 Tax=Massilia sp. MB5 TaxID=2919578 RepID=UPI001F0D4744|nr:helix-turn-helix domain-containing protein [Massilia sp. MB5]UMR29421.1 helix-turn-helix domain-containing protein [Massilia sp. MB5]